MNYEYNKVLEFLYFEGYADSYEEAEYLLEDLDDDEFEELCENVSTGNAKRASFGGIQPRVSAAEADRIRGRDTAPTRTRTPFEQQHHDRFKEIELRDRRAAMIPSRGIRHDEMRLIRRRRRGVDSPSSAAQRRARLLSTGKEYGDQKYTTRTPTPESKARAKKIRQILKTKETWGTQPPKRSQSQLPTRGVRKNEPVLRGRHKTPIELATKKVDDIERSEWRPSARVGKIRAALRDSDKWGTGTRNKKETPSRVPSKGIPSNSRSLRGSGKSPFAVAFTKANKLQNRAENSPNEERNRLLNRARGIRLAINNKGKWGTPEARNEEFVIDYLINEGYTDNYDSAIAIYESMSDEWVNDILEVFKGEGEEYEEYYQKDRGHDDDRDDRKDEAASRNNYRNNFIQRPDKRPNKNIPSIAKKRGCKK